jgi:hypothetical protein
MSTFGFKVMNLVVRTIAKPIVSWVTHYKKMKFKDESDSAIQRATRRRLIWIGQTWNYYNVSINRKLFKISTGNASISNLSEEKSIEKGAEIFGEFFVYSLLIIIPLLEWYRLSKISKHKEMVKENFIQETRLYIDSILKEAKEIDQEINAIKSLIEEIETKLTNNKVNNI